MLQQRNWEFAAGDTAAVARFQYANNQQGITAGPQQMSGPGWEAAIYGEHEVNIITYHVLHATGNYVNPI